MPDLDSIMFTIYIYTHLQPIPGHATRNGNDNCGYFCSANLMLPQTRKSFWWMAQRIVDYYEHVDSDWIQFYSANPIISILLQARGKCQAHLQRHSHHISHALHVYEVNHGRFLISLTLVSCEDNKFEKWGAVFSFWARKLKLDPCSGLEDVMLMLIPKIASDMDIGGRSCWFPRWRWMPPWTEMLRLFMELPVIILSFWTDHFCLVLAWLLEID
jgi:hypothetical protein